MNHFTEKDAERLELTEGCPDSPKLKNLIDKYENLKDKKGVWSLCARHEGECVAGILMVKFPFWENTLEILGLEVCEEWRGLRVAESLLNHALEKAAELGFIYVCAGVRVENEENRARFCAFLEDQGFEYICTALTIRLDIDDALKCECMDSLPEVRVRKREDIDKVAYDSYRRQREKSEHFFRCPADREDFITRYVTDEEGRVVVAASFILDGDTVVMNDVYIEDSKAGAARFIAMYKGLLGDMQKRGKTRLVCKTVNEKCHRLILRMYPGKDIEDNAEYYSIMTE